MSGRCLRLWAACFLVLAAVGCSGKTHYYRNDGYRTYEVDPPEEISDEDVPWLHPSSTLVHHSNGYTPSSGSSSSYECMADNCVGDTYDGGSYGDTSYEDNYDDGGCDGDCNDMDNDGRTTNDVDADHDGYYETP